MGQDYKISHIWKVNPIFSSYFDAVFFLWARPFSRMSKDLHYLLNSTEKGEQNLNSKISTFLFDIQF